jgi:endonuclease/exonuclease/phosphatase family metal-dependent hydrolase
VLTLNLWARQGVWPDRRAVLVSGLRELRPDLVAFQEPIWDDTYDQVVDLLGPDYHVAHTRRGLVPAAEHQGASVASRWPLGRLHEVDLQLTARTADFPCTTLVAEVLAPGPLGRLLFVNHLPSWQRSFEYEREVQTVAAARTIEAIVNGRDIPVVLTGDLDAEPEAASVRFWTGRQALGNMSVCYRDAWQSIHPTEQGYTLSPRNPLRGEPGVPPQPGRRIDYIFVRCGEDGRPTLEIAACALAFDEPVAGVWASDHFGVVADLALPAALGAGS